MIHVDERALDAALERLEQHQAESEAKSGIAGVQARLQRATLRPFYTAMIREINAGATPIEVRRGVVGLISNMLLAVADSVSGREPTMRFNQLSSALVELGFCLNKMMVAEDVGGTETVPVQHGGRA
jgi:hypothetical protein